MTLSPPYFTLVLKSAHDGKRTMNQPSASAIAELQKKFPAALNYLVSIFLIQREYGQTGNTQLAANLGVSKPAVNQAVGRLKKLELVKQDPYGSIRLTDKGKGFAVRTLEKHYLIEHLLITRTDYPWEKSDKEAQLLQTSLSEEFTDYLYEFFQRPQTCPHGNPFPGSPREKELISAPRLIEAPLNTPVEVIRITEKGESEEGLLRFCHKHKLYPGKKLCISSHGEGDGALEIHCNDNDFMMPREIARYICYKTTEEKACGSSV